MKIYRYMAAWVVALVGQTVVAQTPADSLAVGSAPVSAVSKAYADSLYMAGHYADAADCYEGLLAQRGQSADVYYNLANSYYKEGNLARAILNYERALLLRPSDADIRFNLELARNRTVDKVTPLDEPFWTAWLRSLTHLAEADGWGRIAVGFFIGFLVALALYLWGGNILIRKIGFGVGVLCLLLTGSAHGLACRQKQEQTSRTEAVVMAPSVTAKSTPADSGTDLFQLHEGHKVHIKDNTLAGWKEIVLADGHTGWVPAAALEVI